MCVSFISATYLNSVLRIQDICKEFDFKVKNDYILSLRLCIKLGVRK